jgi:hypothetical protein
MLNMISEHKEQSLLIKWCFRHADEFDGLDAIFSIPNGGNRDAITGAMLKREGLRAGIPDLMIPVAKRGKNGLFLEMKKRKGGKVSEKQLAWKTRLEALGYQVEVCKGFAEAQGAIRKYYGKG